MSSLNVGIIETSLHSGRQDESGVERASAQAPRLAGEVFSVGSGNGLEKLDDK